MTVEEILAAMRALIEQAESSGEPMSDEEASRYEDLERQLAAHTRTTELRARQAAYETPVRTATNATGHEVDEVQERAFEHYLRTGQVNSDLVEHRAQGEGVGSEGGFLVPPGFLQKIVDARLAFGGLAEFADEFTTSTGQPLEYPTLNDTANQGAITAESAAFADGADMVFGTVSLGAYKYTSSGAGSSLPLRVSVELLQDAAFDVQALVSRKLGERIARKQAVDWINGTGVGQPQGIFQPAANQSVDVADVLDYDDLLSLEAALDPEYEANARWIMSKGTWTVIRGLVDGDARPLIFDSAASGIAGRPEKQLLGYPVIIDQACATFGAATGPSTNLALGDWREAYALRRVSSLTVVVNPWTRANFGEVEFVAYERADGVVQQRLAYVSLANL